jgi:exodeoxyribonuclease VII large subunit
MNEHIRLANQRTNNMVQQLSPARLQVRVAAARTRFETASAAKIEAIDSHLQQARERLGLAAASLDALSPLAVLQRGYAIAEDGSGKLLRDAAALNEGDEVGVRLAKGKFKAKVSKVSDEG